MTRQEARQPLWPVIPAAAALLLCCGLTAYVALAGAEPEPASLKANAQTATAAGRHSAAVLHYQHLLAIEPGNAGHVVSLAAALDRLKRRPEAIAVLSTVAPLDGGGFAPAHLKLAEWAVESRVLGGQMNGAAIDDAMRHARAAKADPALRQQADALIDILGGMRTP